MAKILGNLTTLQMDDFDGNPVGTFVIVGCVTQLTGPGISLERVVMEECLDDTGPPDIRHAEELPDEISFTLAMDRSDAAYEELLLRISAKDEETYRIVYPLAMGSNSTTGMHEQFEGRLESIKPQAITKREMIKADVVMLRTSAVTLDQGV